VKGEGESQDQNYGVYNGGRVSEKNNFFRLPIFTLKKAAKGTSARCWYVHRTPSCLV